MVIKFKKKKYKKSFGQLTAGFSDKLKNFDFQKTAINIEDYFGYGKGLATALKLLAQDGYISKPSDFQGIYIYIDKGRPFYVGISKGVVNRTIQHTKGHNHQTSSLAYRIGQINYHHQTGKNWDGTRDKFDFKRYCGDAKDFLRGKKIAFLPMQDPTELYLFEVYCAMELGTEMNSFETH
jgi:predicted GIY-YIG superfamily endonuclease